MGLEKINEMRKFRGMEIDELSEKSGVPKGTLSKITAGITKNPSIENVKAIVHAMGFTLDDLDNFPEVKRDTTVSIEALEIAKKYQNLDTHGKEVVNLVLQKETDRCESEYVEIAARGGKKKVKVKKDAIIEWAEQFHSIPYEEDHNLG